MGVLTLSSFVLTNISGLVAQQMLPVKQSDIESYHVPQFNFAIHIIWILALLFDTLSVLAYYRRIFDCIFQHTTKKRKAKWMLWTPNVLVVLWAITSVGIRQNLAVEHCDVL